MSIIKNALRKQIDSNRLLYCNTSTGIIYGYNVVMNTAKIKYHNPNGDGWLYRDNVKFADIMGGTTGAGIYPGQLCILAFIDNDIHYPIITGLVYNNYASKTCSDQGAYIVDSDILSCKKPENITPMIDIWIEENNDNPYKYNNDLWDYTETDTLKIIHEELNSLDKYKPTEQGITNLETKSTIKFKDNGDIDIFIDNNTGIRISKADKSINLYGTVKINGQIWI